MSSPSRTQLPCERVIKRQFLPIYPSPENSAYWRSSRGPESAKKRVLESGKCSFMSLASCLSLDLKTLW